jgi:glycine/D-amino acid oxidase-like deaminating enzyme
LTVAVIGGGIQGCLTAIECELRGHQVFLFEREKQLLRGASRWSEGKIHLGYLFAKDPSLRTARTLVDGATRFAPLMERYLGRTIDYIPRSSGFVYGVHRDSMLMPDEIGAHLFRVHALASEALATGDRNYLGQRRLAAPRPVAASRYGLNDVRIQSAYLTQEKSLDAVALAGAVERRILGSTRINCLTGRAIAGISRANGGFVLDEPSGLRHGPFKHVVNAAWEGRLALDASLGYRPPYPWLHRLKVGLRGRVGTQAGALPSVTIVLGPFGDLVNFGNDQLYLSWYPVGRIAASTSLTPPPVQRQIQAARRSAIASTILDRLSELVPELARVDRPGSSLEINGGYIFAWGKSDIDDARSRLHRRYEIGVHSHRGYHSIDTGKLTMAPLNAEVVGQRIGDFSSG